MEVVESIEPKTRKLKHCPTHNLPKCQDCIRERKRINSKIWRERKKLQYDKEAAVVTGVPVNHQAASLRFLPYGPFALSQEAIFNDFFGIEPAGQQQSMETNGSVTDKQSPPQSLPGSPGEEARKHESNTRTLLPFTVCPSAEEQFTQYISVDVTKSFYEILLQLSNKLSSNGGLVTARDLRMYWRMNKNDKTMDLEIDANSLVQQILKDFSSERDCFVVKKV